MIKLIAANVERNGRRILKDASLALKPGELKGIAGPNGGGKSTLLKVMAGLWRPDSGAVLLDGQPLEALSRRTVARAISFVPQDEHVDFDFTVEQIVAMGRFPHRSRFAPETDEDRSIVEAAMERCDVANLRRRKVNTLSGGEQQRTFIARSLAVQAPCILLDEPTASLDLEHAIEVLELCKELAEEGKAVALVTHDVNALARYATESVLVYEGNLVASGPTEEVLTTGHLEYAFRVRAEELRSADGGVVYQFHKK